jgi:hypothetical protein
MIPRHHKSTFFCRMTIRGRLLRIPVHPIRALMSNRDHVLQYLLSIGHAGATNEQIVSHTGIRPHQQVFMITRQLMQSERSTASTKRDADEPARPTIGRVIWEAKLL